MKEYPKTLDDLVNNPESSQSWNGPYFKKGKLPMDPWGNDYIYENPSADERKRVYDIISFGPDSASGGDGFNADITSFLNE